VPSAEHAIVMFERPNRVDRVAFGGCEQGSEVEFWTIDGGAHTPGITADFSAGVIDFLLAHPKP
jgi:hypothetical protein